MDKYPFPLSNWPVCFVVSVLSAVAAYLWITSVNYKYRSIDSIGALDESVHLGGEAGRKSLTAKKIKREELKRERRIKRNIEDEVRKVKERRDQELRDLYQRKQDEKERLRQEDACRSATQAYDAYKELVESFTIDQEGSILAHEEVNIEDFEYFVTWRKITNIVELSAQFGIPPKAIVDRLLQLELQERLFGVLDERGRYLYITDGEVDALVRYIEQSGRINKHRSLVSFCNTTFSLQPKGDDRLRLEGLGNTSLQRAVTED